jgi:5-methylcytosine-specific restriction endonuclease McrBC GTP-binding regulatory subunit McrB
MKTPDRWVVIKIKTPEETILKLFSTWFGGYAGNDSWRLNSGITEIIEEDNYYIVKGHSETVYKIGKNNTGTSGYTGGVLQHQILERIPDYIETSVILDIDEVIEILKEIKCQKWNTDTEK